MTTTIKLDGTLLADAWQDDQALSPDSAVDVFVPGTNVNEYFPESTLGTGGDAAPTTKGAAGTDKVK